MSAQKLLRQAGWGAVTAGISRVRGGTGVRVPSLQSPVGRLAALVLLVFVTNGASCFRSGIPVCLSQVFQASLKLLKMVITQYIPRHRLGRLETTHCVESTVPVLLARTGDSSGRLRVLACNFIQV